MCEALEACVNLSIFDALHELVRDGGECCGKVSGCDLVAHECRMFLICMCKSTARGLSCVPFNVWE